VRKRVASVMLTAWVAVGWPAFARASAPPAHLAAVFGALPRVSGVALSRSGRMLAWIQRQGSQRSVVVYDYLARRVQRVFHVDPRMRPWDLRWDGSGMLLVSIEMTVQPQIGANAARYSIARTLALNIKTGQIHLLLMSGNGRQYVDAAQLLRVDPHRSHSVIMFTYEWSRSAYRSSIGHLIVDAQRDSGWMGNLFAVDPYTGDDEVIGYGNAFTIGWVVNPDGKPVAREQYHPRHHRFLLQARRGSRWVSIYQRTDGVAPWLPSIARGGEAILALMPAGDGVEHLWRIPLDGAAPERLLPGVRRPVVSAEVSRSGRLVGVTLGGGRMPFRWLNAAARARYESVVQAFESRPVSVYDATRSGEEVLVKERSPVRPPSYYLTDFQAHRAMLIGRAYPRLAHVPLGTVESLAYRTRNGREIRARLFVPPAAAHARHLPLIVLPPGGPESGPARRFDWLADYLAMNGYLVLRPALSPVGDSGPAMAGTLQQWDGLAQHYAIDGVRVLVKAGLVDAHRVCIVGVAYGGYAALAGAAFWPHAYACAVSINGIADLPAFVRYEDKFFSGVNSASAAAAYWRAALGSASDPRLIAESPVHAAAAIRAPVLLLHSVDDAAVPFSQSQEMAHELTALGKPVTLIRLRGVDHSLDRGATRIAVLRAIAPFLRRYLR
jgi:dipeptidyl aminopeptidase/acylaminoacyl peptidase